jgi:hypothetical protein
MTNHWHVAEDCQYIFVFAFVANMSWPCKLSHQEYNIQQTVLHVQFEPNCPIGNQISAVF